MLFRSPQAAAVPPVSCPCPCRAWHGPALFVSCRAGPSCRGDGLGTAQAIVPNRHAQPLHYFNMRPTARHFELDRRSARYSFAGRFAAWCAYGDERRHLLRRLSTRCAARTQYSFAVPAAAHGNGGRRFDVSRGAQRARVHHDHMTLVTI